MQCGRHPDQPAVLGLERPALDYAQLYRFVEETTARLNARGISRGDRIAVVLPNGPAMATCFLAGCSAATCAPLNPGYRASEFEFYLSDLKAKALLVEAGSESPSIGVAEKLGLQILRIRHVPGGRAGEFVVESEAEGCAEELQNPLTPLERAARGALKTAGPVFAEPDDVALVLHTSGTTSRPKLVPLTHANLCQSAENIRRTLALTPGDLCMNVMPLFHIHGLIGALLSCLAAGAAVACTPGFVAPEFFAWFSRFRPTWYSAVPTIHQAILARAAEHADVIRSSRLRFIRSSSAPLPPQTMAALESTFGVPVIEAYGMTEASHQMASNPLPPRPRKPGSVGPAAGPQIAIMDSAGNLLAPAQQGEVVIRGLNVTAAYENNPKANQESFANGWFRTGDQGWLDEEGYLFLTGRIKEIINRGGEKISPREVDEALLEHPAIAQAVAFAIPDERLGEEVGAAVVLRPGAILSEQEVQEFAATRLADFKIPRRVIFPPEIPKGPTGKPQRIGLAARLGVVSRIAEIQERPAARPPESAVALRLAGIWSQVLGTGDIGLDSDFFDLGGDSILAAQLIARVREEFASRLSLPQFFRLPTLARMAEWLERQGHESSKDEPLPITKTESLSLSFSEERIWFLDEYERDKSVYVRFSAFRLSGPLDGEALRRAVRVVLSRHEITRTTYAKEPELCALVNAVPADLDVPLIDLSALPGDQQDSELRRLALEESRRPFDLKGDLLLRVRLVRLAKQEHVLLFASHHIAFDGWSDTVLFRELGEAYSAFTEHREPAPPLLPFQYRDLAQWQRTRLDPDRKRNLVDYWLGQLDGLAPLLPLPLDHNRPPRQTFTGATEFLDLDSGLVRQLKQLSRRRGVTFFTPLLAAFGVLLGRYSGVEDVAIGTPVANRPTAETEKLIGYFSNTLIFRLNLEDDPTGLDLLDRTRQTVLGALDHQDLPFELLVETLNPTRSLSYHPLVQVLFQLRNLPARTLALKDIRASEVRWDFAVSPFDLALDLIETDEGVSCRATYNTDLFERETISRLLGHYQVLLHSLADTPEKHLSELRLLDDGDRHRLLVEFNATAAPGADIPATRLFEEIAANQPDRVAVKNGHNQLSYGELNRRANVLARYLQARGLKPGDRVAAWFERSPESVLSTLALWKLGGVYVPLDINYPSERLRFMVEDAGASLLLTVSELASSAPSGIPSVLVDSALGEIVSSSGNLCSEPDLDTPVYLMYTSGSTGWPKGVPVLHRGVANFAFWLRQEFATRNTDVLNAASLTFDMAVFELLVALVTGGTLLIVKDSVWTNPADLIRELHRVRPGGLSATPSYLRVLLDSGVFRETGNLQWVHSGGETLTPELARRFLNETSLELVNMYGPTETSILTHRFWVKREHYRTVPIGRPIANTTAYVLGRRRELLPIGVTGELYIGGRGVAPGYVNRPDLTAERFLPNPFSEQPGERLYRTGDLARFRPDGNLEYQGRVDHQVKIRGYRIETAEIETVLMRHPMLAQAAVQAQSFGPDDGRLVAYVAKKSRTEHVDELSLREYLEGVLPRHMVPSRFVFLDELPLASNGKVARNKLAPIPLSAKSQPRAARPPADRTEAGLTRLWEELLKVGSVGVDDNFFDLGGHSLLAVRLFTEIEHRFGRRLPLAALFEAPTIAELAARLRCQVDPDEWRSLVAIQPGGTHPPLFCLHAVEGDVLFYRDLALLLGAAQPVFALRSRGLDGSACPTTIEEMARQYLEEMRSVQASGPYFLAGFCSGAYVAYEMARQLTQAGEQVAFLANFSTDGAWKTIASLSGQLRYHREGISAQGAASYLGERLEQRSRMALSAAAARIAGRFRITPVWLRRSRVRAINRRAAVLHSACPWPGRMTYFMGEGDRHRDPALYWGPLVFGGLDIRLVPGSQLDMFREPNVRALARSLGNCLEEAREVFSTDSNGVRAAAEVS